MSKGCGNCYYDWFDERAYPCSLCIRGIKRTDKWMPSKKTKEKLQNHSGEAAEMVEPQTEEDILREQCRAFIDIVNYTERSRQ